MGVFGTGYENGVFLRVRDKLPILLQSSAIPTNRSDVIFLDVSSMGFDFPSQVQQFCNGFCATPSKADCTEAIMSSIGHYYSSVR
jgi:hypothetical protein